MCKFQKTSLPFTILEFLGQSDIYKYVRFYITDLSMKMNIQFIIRPIALKIHVSTQKKKILSIFGNFQLELRGPVKMMVQRRN